MTAAEKSTMATVERLAKYADEITDLRGLITSAHRLVAGLTLSGDPEDAADDEEAVDAARVLLSIARRGLRYLESEVADDLKRLDGSAPSAPSASA